MKSKNKWDLFALIVTILTSIIVIGSSIEILLNL
jgi:heme/copper-type cytochrome/quinol oxidase subunit 4